MKVPSASFQLLGWEILLVSVLHVIECKEKGFQIELLEITLSVVHRWCWEVLVYRVIGRLVFLSLCILKNVNLFIDGNWTFDVNDVLILHQWNVVERIVKHFQKQFSFKYLGRFVLSHWSIKLRNILDIGLAFVLAMAWLLLVLISLMMLLLGRLLCRLLSLHVLDCAILSAEILEWVWTCKKTSTWVIARKTLSKLTSLAYFERSDAAG